MDVCVHTELRINDVRNEMMDDDDSSFLATDFGWWLQLWVGSVLDRHLRGRVGLRADGVVHGGDLMRKHHLTYMQGELPLVHAES